MWKFLKRGFAIVMVSLISLEMMSVIAVHAGLIAANIPSYTWPSFTPFWAATDRNFGMWHPPDAHYNHVKSCYNLVYRTNSFGARDRERAKKSSLPRVIMLGDSFVEGYGLGRTDRVSDRLEAKTGIPHLNFGTSGGFGPTQYLLQYETLAKTFDHRAVIVSILPDNDFFDDDPDRAARQNDPRYAPYFHAGAGKFGLKYRNAAETEHLETANRQAWKRGLRSLPRSFSYAANVIDHLQAQIAYQSAAPHAPDASPTGYSGFYDFTPTQLARLEYVLTRLIAALDDRPMVVVLIPRPNDLARMRRAANVPLVNWLQAFLKSHTNVTLLDLSIAFSAHPNSSDLFNRCDGHWSPTGAALATKLLSATGLHGTLTN